MADQWQSTADHADMLWQSTADHSHDAERNITDVFGVDKELFPRSNVPGLGSALPGLADVAAGALSAIPGLAKGAVELGYKLRGKDAPPFLTPEGDAATRAPANPAGFMGRTAADAAIFGGPASAVGTATKGLPLAARALAEGVTAGGVAALQSGGDPLTTGLAAAGGTVAPLAGAAIKSVVDKFSEALHAGSGPQGALKIAVDFAEKHNIPLTYGQKHGNEAAQYFEEMLPGTPGPGGKTASAFFGKQREALTREANSAAVQLDPRSAPTTVEAGESLAKQLRSRYAAAKDFADKRYGQFRSIIGNDANAQMVQTGERVSPLVDSAGRPITSPVMSRLETPVDIQSAKQQLRPLYDELAVTMPEAQRQASPGFAALRQIMDAPNTIPTETLDKNLSAIKSLIRRSGKDYGTSRSQGIAMQTVGALEKNLEDTLSTAGGDVLSKLKQARKAVGDYHDVGELIASLPTEPAKVYDRVMQGKDRSLNLVSDLKQYAPNEVRQFGKTFVQGMIDRMTENGQLSKVDGVIRQWQNLGNDTKNILFDGNTEGVKNFTDMLTAVRQLTDIKNKSKSGHAVAALETIQGGRIPGLNILRNKVLADVLFEKDGAKAVTNLLRAPQGSPIYDRSLATVVGIANGLKPAEATR